jgi:hypothetical protein
MTRSTTVHLLLVSAVVLICARPSLAQIGPVPSLADPRLDPLLLAPVINAQTQVRVAGAVQGRRSIVDAADYVVAGRLTLWPPTGSAVSFDVALRTVPDTLSPFRAGFTGTIKLFELIGDVPANTGATLTLDCVNCPRGSRISGGMHLEDVSLVPAYASYAVSVLDPIDPVIDLKIDPIIDSRTDSMIPLPVITSSSQLQVVGVVHATRGFIDNDGLPLGSTMAGRLTVQFPDGASRWFDITFTTIHDKDVPARMGFNGVISPALIGETPTNSSAILTLACVNCPRGALINAGVYVEEISLVGHPSFLPYVVGSTPSVPDPTPMRRAAQ